MYIYGGDDKRNPKAEVHKAVNAARAVTIAQLVTRTPPAYPSSKTMAVNI